jgi:hypothetical protein
VPYCLWVRNWAPNLHDVLADKGVYVAHVAINTMIGTDAPEGIPHTHPHEIAAVGSYATAPAGRSGFTGTAAPYR